MSDDQQDPRDSYGAKMLDEMIAAVDARPVPKTLFGVIAEMEMSDTLEIKWSCYACGFEQTNLRPLGADANIFRCIDCGKVQLHKTKKEMEGES